MKRDFTIVIERDEGGIDVASVTGLIVCRMQAKTLGELRKGMPEVV